MVSTHSRLKAAGAMAASEAKMELFQHTAARRRLGDDRHAIWSGDNVSTHSRLKTAAPPPQNRRDRPSVSTHSRLKAAASGKQHNGHCLNCFNTQPPEGGCQTASRHRQDGARFNTQPPEGGCAHRLRADLKAVCFNTQPPEGGCEYGS